MPTFDLISDIEKYASKIIANEIVKFGEQVKIAAKQELKAKFYGRAGFAQDQQATDWYNRTWQLLESITLSPVKRTGNEYTVRIYYKTGAMSTISGADGMWSTHESIIDGRDFRSTLPEVIEYGNPSSIYRWEPFNIFGDLEERLINDHAILQWFEKAFRKAGFDVIIG